MWEVSQPVTIQYSPPAFPATAAGQRESATKMPTEQILNRSSRMGKYTNNFLLNITTVVFIQGPMSTQ